jgi:phospholipase D1/2
LHPNLKVFRYPDHYVSGNSIVTGLKELGSGIKDFSLQKFNLARASEDVIKSLYGTAEDVVLYFAHQYVHVMAWDMWWLVLTRK